MNFWSYFQYQVFIERRDEIMLKIGVFNLKMKKSRSSERWEDYQKWSSGNFGYNSLCTWPLTFQCISKNWFFFLIFSKWVATSSQTHYKIQFIRKSWNKKFKDLHLILLSSNKQKIQKSCYKRNREKFDYNNDFNRHFRFRLETRVEFKLVNRVIKCLEEIL